MDHPNQNTMLLPASYAVISEEEMTYLDGGQSIYLGSAFNHDIYFNTDQFATFCQNAAINLFVLMTNYSFRYIAGRVQSGLSNGLSLSGTFYHTWDKMNGWSKLALFGMGCRSGRCLCLFAGHERHSYRYKHLRSDREPHAEL